MIDSDENDQEDYMDLEVDVGSPSDRVKKLIAKRSQTIQRHKRYLKANTIAELNFLANKSSKRRSTIVSMFPDIGTVIEDFVKENNVGADRWRRTGTLTFYGNTNVGKKVTFKCIKEHLEEVYGRRFAYGTVVELCVARNCRRRSAARYRGLANVTCRRSRKGFQLKLNPDNHWSSAFYRSLNQLQYCDGRHLVNVNRDDASGFRLDTLATHRLHRTPALKGQDTLTTYTDYVSKYPATISVTSYNFSATKTTAEHCAGVVKASGIYPKNPAQHAADLQRILRSYIIFFIILQVVTEKQLSV